jgi:hypothetical protein
MERTPPPPTAAAEEAAWLERWRRHEIGHLAARVEELRRRLRRRTLALGGALAVILVLTGALTILAARPLGFGLPPLLP